MTTDIHAVENNLLKAGWLYYCDIQSVVCDITRNIISEFREETCTVRHSDVCGFGIQYFLFRFFQNGRERRRMIVLM
jgi:hypothetical protein